MVFRPVVRVRGLEKSKPGSNVAEFKHAWLRNEGKCGGVTSYVAPIFSERSTSHDESQELRSSLNQAKSYPLPCNGKDF